MHQSHTNQTPGLSPDDPPPLCQDALSAFWKTVHEEMRESFDEGLEENGAELHIKPFWNLILAAVWENRIGLTLFAFDWHQTHQDFSPPSYLDQEQVQWLVEVAARHGIHHKHEKEPEA